MNALIPQFSEEDPKEISYVSLTSSELLLMGFVAACGKEGCFTPKANLAQALRVSEKTVDRAVKSLRDKKLLISTPCFSENGTQTANIYNLAWSVEDPLLSEEIIVTEQCS